MKATFTILALLLYTIQFGAGAHAESDLFVSSADDTGEVGTLRWAVETANAAAGPCTVRIDAEIDRIRLQRPLVFTGDRELTIIGTRHDRRSPTTLFPHPRVYAAHTDALGQRNASLLICEVGGGDLTLVSLALGGSIDNGVDVLVPAGKKAQTISIQLSDVSLAQNQGSGILVRETNSGFSMRDIHLTIHRSVFKENGTSGVRVQERDHGTVEFRAVDSLFIRNGTDGVLLEESHRGHVGAVVRTSDFRENGTMLPGRGIALVEDGPGSAAARIIGDCTFRGNSEDAAEIDEAGDGSVEMRLEGVAFLDCGRDGLDIDEHGAGNVIFSGAGLIIDGALDDGLDVNENGDGDLDFDLFDSTVSNIKDDAVKVSESCPDVDCVGGAGSGVLQASFVSCVIDRSHGDDGIQAKTMKGGEGDRLYLQDVVLRDIADHCVKLNHVPMEGTFTCE